MKLLVSLLGLLVAAGQPAAPVTLEDQAGQRRAVPDPKLPVLVIYEDQVGQKQNAAAKELVGAYNRIAENRAKLAVLPVADLEKWNWWPAKKYALADVQKSAAKNNTTIFVDFTGQVRKAWGLAKGKNSMILVAPDGKVLFASEGEASEAQRAALETQLQTLGLSR